MNSHRSNTSRSGFELIGALLAVYFLSGCAGRFPLVGYDKDGKPTMAMVNEDKYIDHLSESLLSVQDSTFPALNHFNQEEFQWKLRTAMIGFGLKIEVGFGPFGVGVKPRIRLAFVNGEKPPIP